MSRSNKRKVTASLLLTAGAAVVVALVLYGGQDQAVASRTKTKPTLSVAKVSKIVLTPGKSTPVKPGSISKPEPVKPLQVKPKVVLRPKVDVVFALDTTGSMGGLIAGAKKKIWTIANQVLSGQPRPDVRIGLIAYRDRGDAYVTRRHGLSEDIDDVYANLRRFKAGGGGDTPEHVNRALSEAIHKMEWRKGQDVLRLIFLVGDAPPQEGRDGLRSGALARQASKAGIIINAVRCGSMGATARAWKLIAGQSGGMYASIRQDGGMVAMATPMDTRMAELNKELSGTLLPSGSATDKAATMRRVAGNIAMAPRMQAESAKFRARSGKLDSNDLLNLIGKGADMDSMPAEDLPAPVAAMPKPARKAYVAGVAKKRAKLKTEIQSLAKNRDAFIKKQRKARGGGKGFDDTVQKALEKQGAKIGVAY